MLLLIFLLGGGRKLHCRIYMGVVRLPAKEDYFPGNRSDVLPA
jgi:hypothetical protein